MESSLNTSSTTRSAMTTQQQPKNEVQQPNEEANVKADLWYNDFKNSGEIYRYEANRALQEQLKWQD